jgi:S1-C subfamily serine protease
MLPGGATARFDTGTGFMVAPGILATVAHVVRREGNPEMPLHQSFQVIRSPEIGQSLESAVLLAEDADRDVAFLRILNPRSSACVALRDARVPTGTSCGCLGFPLSGITVLPTGAPSFNLLERFQGSSVSSYNILVMPNGHQLALYETDAVSYPGISGSPAFLVTGEVFAMAKGSISQNPQSTMTPATQTPDANQQPADLRNRLAISVLVPAISIIELARQHAIEL